MVSDASGILTNYENNFDGISRLIKDLQGPIYVRDQSISQWRAYGPYLDNPNGSTIASYTTYAPQWNLKTATGMHTGYLVQITKGNSTTTCIPVTGDIKGTPTSLSSDSPPGILVID